MTSPRRLATHPLLGDFNRGAVVSIIFDGQPLTAHVGEPLSAALMAADVVRLRVSRTGEPRGMYCAIGQCMECRVVVDGVGTQRACLTPVVEGLVASTFREMSGEGTPTDD